MLAASRCALAIRMLTMTTKVTQISLVVWVALGKHEIAQQLVGHPCSVKKQISVAENSFDCFMMCTVYKNAFQKRLQACKLFVIPHKTPRYSGLSSIKYQLDECKIWGNDSRQCSFQLSFIKVLKTSRLFRQNQDQDQDHFHVLEAPRDQDQGLETTSLTQSASDTEVMRICPMYLVPRSKIVYCDNAVDYEILLLERARGNFKVFKTHCRQN